MGNEFSKLKGKRVLLTRPRHQAAETIKKLKKAGAKVIHIPLIEITDPSDNFKSLDRAISRLEIYDWLIFTSQNAVDRFFARLSLRGVKWRDRHCEPAGRSNPVDKPGLLRLRLAMTKRFAAVGPATAAALRKHGIRKVIVPRKDNYSAAGLVDMLKKYDFKDKRVLFPCAKKAKEILPIWLKKQGAKLDKVEAYQTVMPKNVNRERLRKLITENRIDEVLFFSQSAKENFTKITGRKRAK